MERKSLRLWTKIKLLVKVKLGLPTNKTRNKEDLIVDKDISSLEHTRWRCQYHVVFAPKYRRLAIYGELKQDIGYILRKLCERKGIEIIEAEACPDHIHMLISIPPKLSVSQVMGYLKGKSSLMIFDRHANLKYKYGKLCGHGRTEQESDSGVYPESAEGRRTSRPTKYQRVL